MRTSIIGRVLGALGLVILLSTVITLFFGNPSFVGAKLVLGLGGIVASFVMGESGGLKRFFTGRALHFGLLTAFSALALIVVLGIANWTSYKHPKSWDLTKDKLFTLQEDTLKTVKGLKSDVKAIAVYRMDEEGYAQAESLLKRYADLSPRFTFTMVDPYKSPDLAKTYGMVSGGPRIVLVAGAQKAPVNVPDEQNLTNALVKVTHGGSKKLYFLTGHGEPAPSGEDLRAYGAVGVILGREGYEVATLSLLEKPEIPADAAAVIVAGARVGLLKNEVAALERFAAAGGHLGLFFEPDVTTGLEGLAKSYGVQVNDDIVADTSQAAQLLGSPVSPVAMPSAEHEITRELATTFVVFPTARSLTAAPGVTPAPAQLAQSTPEAWGESDVKGVFKGEKFRYNPGEKMGPLVLAMATERPVSAEGKRSDRARVVVAGDSDFFSNKYIQLGSNSDFFMNSVNWLAEQEDRITIRAKHREGSIVYLTSAQATTLKFLSVDVLPVALLGLGLAVWMVRRSR